MDGDTQFRDLDQGFYREDEIAVLERRGDLPLYGEGPGQGCNLRLRGLLSTATP